MLEGFQLSATLGIAMMDSYGALNQLNAAYSVFAVVVAVGMSVVSTHHAKLHWDSLSVRCRWCSALQRMALLSKWTG